MTALKTLSLRIRGAKADLEESGLETDGMADSVSKLRSEIQKLTGIDIMIDDNTFKSTYQILKEISSVWDDLTDVTQANVLELMFAKRQANVGAAILSDFDIAEKALKTSQESYNSAMRENEIYLDSIKGRMDKLTASAQAMSSTLLDTGVVKGTISALTTVLDLFTKIVDLAGSLPLIIGTIGTLWTKDKKVGRKYALLYQAA